MVKIAGYNIKFRVNLQQKHWDQHTPIYTHHLICIFSECVRRGGGGGVKYKKLWRKDEIERLVGLETKLTIRGDACNSARWGINQIDTQWKAF